MDHRHLLVALALIAVGCGRGRLAPGRAGRGHRARHPRLRLDHADPGPGGARRVRSNALRRSAKVGTSYGGRFVESINGVEGKKSEGWDWLYFVNGIDPGVGAADTTLHSGDREWWDYRYWKDFIGVPAVIGAWPEPFVHGLDGKRPHVQVQGPACAGQLGDELERAGARVGDGTAPFDVRVATFDEVSSLLTDWERWAFTVRLAGGRSRSTAASPAGATCPARTR